MPSLTSLNLNDCTGLSSEAIAGLAGACSDLRQLQISRCTHVSDSALASLLSTTPLLERLNVDGCSKVGNEALLAACFNCPLLRELHCWTVPLLSDETLECFVSAAAGRSACSALETLDLGECTALTASALAAFFRVTPRLKSLDLTSCKLSDNVLLSISGAPLLTHLSLSKCTGVTDAGIVAIADGCAQLVHLDLNSCSDLTGDALQALNVGCASLKKPLVNLSGCSKISDDVRRKWLLATPGPSADAASKRASPPPYSSVASAIQSPAGSAVLTSEKASAAHAAATATPSPLPEPCDHSSSESFHRPSAGTRAFPLTFESEFSSSSSSAQGASSESRLELSEQAANPSKRSRH